MLHGEQEHFTDSLVGKKEVAVVDDELHKGFLIGAKDSCKPFYEVLVDAVHEKKGSLDISLLSAHCRFDGVDANLADHTELVYRSKQGVNYRAYLRRKLSTRSEVFLAIKDIEGVQKISPAQTMAEGILARAGRLNSGPFRDESSWEGVMESQSYQR